MTVPKGRCPECDATGVLTCKHCLGTGEKKFPCPNCEGGTVRLPCSNRRCTKGKVWGSCPNCRGSQTLRCPRCKGKKVI